MQIMEKKNFVTATPTEKEKRQTTQRQDTLSQVQ